MKFYGIFLTVTRDILRVYRKQSKHAVFVYIIFNPLSTSDAYTCQ